MHSFRFRQLLLAGLTVVTLNSSAQAQGVPAAPAGVGGAAPAAGGGASVSAGAAGAAAGAAVGIGAGGGYDPGTGLGDIHGAFRPASFSAVMTPTAVPATPINGVAGSGGGMGSLIPTLLNCVAQGAQMKAIADTQNALNDFSTDQEFRPEKKSGLSRREQRRYGSGINSMFPGEQGCQKFINKEGEIGPWGRIAFAEMENGINEDIYKKKIPADVENFCPNFNSIHEDRRKYFWLWFFAAMSKPESSCRTNAVNTQAPNGDAIGLFQLEKPACDRVNVNGSSSDLYEARHNIRCAVALFAEEMRHRDSMFIGTSKPPAGTYWAPLRNDGNDSGNESANQRMARLLKGYPECNGPIKSIRYPTATQTKEETKAKED